MKLTSAHNDRASGVMLAMACGDALGAGYEFGPPFEGEVLRKGGNGFNWAPGEWTDDTSMAIPILRAAASGRDLRGETVLDEIVAAWIDWAKTAPDVETKQPRDFTKNGWVVEALQAAWSAIVNGEGLVDTLERAVRGGRDTDTVAAIAGGLIGARWGLSAIPAAWQRIVHGWPHRTSLDLVQLSTEVVRGKPTPERVDYARYGDISTPVQHPHDDGVWLGAVGSLDALPPEVDAVVSLCRIGSKQVPEYIRERIEIRLIDRVEPEQNPNLNFVLADAADTVAILRAGGHTVLLHCVQAQSRTPTVAALYAARYLDMPSERALSEVCAALPSARPNRAFRNTLADSELANK